MFRPDKTNGYRVAFHADEVNHCPGCGGTQWLVGRIVAECAFCAAAVPLASAGMTGAGLFRANHVPPDSLAPRTGSSTNRARVISVDRKPAVRGKDASSSLGSC